MQFSTFAFVTILPLLASSLPTAPTVPDQQWQVTSFKYGCSPGGCSYGFNIAILADTAFSVPAISTSCEGVEHGVSNYTSCSDASVRSSTGSTDPGAVGLFIQHIHGTDGGIRYTYTANTTIESGYGGWKADESFTISPSSVTGVL